MLITIFSCHYHYLLLQVTPPTRTPDEYHMTSWFQCIMNVAEVRLAYASISYWKSIMSHWTWEKSNTKWRTDLECVYVWVGLALRLGFCSIFINYIICLDKGYYLWSMDILNLSLQRMSVFFIVVILYCELISCLTGWSLTFKIRIDAGLLK